MTKTQKGLLYGLGAYLFWASIAIFWKWLAGVSPYDALAYRIIWTCLTMLLYMLVTRQTKVYGRLLAQVWADKRLFWTMLGASLFISLNWLTYIYAIGQGKATQASLGYYVMPLVSVALSVFLLKEELSKPKWLAVALAALGVGVMVWQTGQLPIITLLLAFSFSFYGFLKKSVQLPSHLSMFLETAFVFPLALIYLLFFSRESLADYSLAENLLLPLSGAVTAIPLLLFAEGVRRAPLNLIGFIQYINPSIQLLVALTLFGETISPGQWQGMLLIWSGILVFSLAQWREMRQTK